MGGRKRTLVFTYGTLKQGFSNHGLLDDMIRRGEASYVGTYHTDEPLPLVCGPYRVPFLLNLPGKGHHVWGELYEVSAAGLARMDDLEGTRTGHYERLPLLVSAEPHAWAPPADADGAARPAFPGPADDDEGAVVVRAEAYFAHRSYAGQLWKRNGERGFGVYSEKEARGYVKRKDRPQGVSFLDHIQAFVSSAPFPVQASYEV